LKKRIIAMKTRIFLIIAIVFLNSSLSAQEKKASVQLTTAIYEEEVTGNLDKAAELYLDILKKYPDDRPVAAKTLYHLGLINEKMGRQKASEYFTQLIKTYPDQTDMVVLAKSRLAALDIGPVARSTGITIRQVWSGPDVDIYGTPSPDGIYLSYTDWETGDLVIRDLSTGIINRLTNKGSFDNSDEYAFMSSWSPDSKQIVYGWYNGNDYYDLRIIGLDGSKPRILYSNNEVKWIYTYDWSPDGEQILAYFDRKIGTDMIGQIVLVSTADGSVQVLKTTTITKTGVAYPENMCFSHDGRYVVYDFPQKTDFPERDIFLFSTDGNLEMPLVEHPSYDELLGCAPDGKSIIFASDRNGTFSLWSKQISEGKSQENPELVMSSMGSIEPLGFTRGGSFYYGYSKKSNNIFIVELDPETGEILVAPKQEITRFEGYNQTPEYSPDGKYLAYISRRFPLTIYPDYTIAKMGGNVLCIKSLDTGKEREFFPDLDRFAHPRWSPDGSSVIVLESNKSGSNQIDIQTGNVTPVLYDDNIGPQPTERSHDGKTIFYVLHNEKAKIYQIIERDLINGTEKEIYRSDGGLHIRLSPDDQWLAIQSYYMENYQGLDKIPVLSVTPVAGGEPLVLCRFEEGIDLRVGAPFTWTPDGKYILFTMKSPEKDNDKWDLYRVPVKGGITERLGLEMGGFLINLSVHPDGRHIAFSTSEQSNAEIWVMENFLPK
jgi:Tol biopolymer transport system component